MIKHLNLSKGKIIGVLFAVTLLFITTFAFADYAKYKAGTEKGFGLAPLIMGWMDEILCVDSLDSVQSLVEVRFNFDADTIVMGGMTFTGMSGAVKEVNRLFIIAATVIIVICFLINLNKEYLKMNELPPEMLAKKIVVLGIGLVLIGKSLWICEQIANFGSGMTSAVINALNKDPSSAAQVDAIKSAIYDDCSKEVTGWFLEKISIILTNIFSGIQYLFQLLLPWLAMKIVNVIVSFTCWGRAVNILILSAMSPIAFADIISERSGGEKFIRNLLSVSLSGIVIVLTMFFCGRIMGNIMTETCNGNFLDGSFINGIYKLVVIGFVEAGLVTKSINVTKEFVGMA